MGSIQCFWILKVRGILQTDLAYEIETDLFPRISPMCPPCSSVGPCLEARRRSQVCSRSEQHRHRSTLSSRLENLARQTHVSPSWASYPVLASTSLPAPRRASFLFKLQCHNTRGAPRRNTAYTLATTSGTRMAGVQSSVLAFANFLHHPYELLPNPLLQPIQTF